MPFNLNVLSSHKTQNTDKASGTITRCLALVDILQSVGDMVPVFGGPLKGIAGLACKVITVVKDIRTSREGCALLAEKAGRLALSVLHEAIQVEASPMTSHMTARLERFYETLNEISEFMTSRLSLQNKWYENVLGSDSFQDTLDYHTARLEEAYSIFNITTLVEVHRIAAKIADSLKNLTLEHASMAQVLMANHKIHNRPAILESRAFESSQSDSIEELQFNVINRTELELIDVIPQSCRQMNVIVKIYRSRTKKIKDLRRLISILHSHVHTLIGQSPVEEPSPYLVISDYSIQRARAFLEAQIVSVNDVHGFMASLSMLAGVASALQYLYKDIQLRKADLEECVKVSNLYITPNGKVVVGRDLFAADPEDSESDDTISGDLSEWLKIKFWFITMGLLYGGIDAIDFTQWQSVQTRWPHIKPLLTLSAYHCPTFTLMSERLTNLSDTLKPAQNDGQLTYAMIRKEMLKLPQCNPTAFFKPPVPLNIAYGDIGYMKDGDFVKLDNMRDAFKDETKINPHYEDYLRTSGAGAISSKDLGDGIIRHTFEDTVYIEIRVARWGDSNYVADVHKFWPLFIDKARMIKRLYGEEHKFAISDLLFVMRVGNDYRQGRFTFDLNKGTNKTIPCIQLMEYTNAGPDEKWAEWIVVDEVLYSPDQLVPFFQRHPQYITFVQLQKGDVPELEDGQC